MNEINPIRFIFFGSSPFSVYILEELLRAGFSPTSIVTTRDKPRGRGLTLSPTVVKEWANKKNIKVHTPDKLDHSLAELLKLENSQIFLVASYGKIIPQIILDIPIHKTLNVHPSLLPLYRGSSPLQTTIIDNAKDTGVTIIRLNEKMDEGPIVAQEKITISEWPIYEVLEEKTARIGGILLAKVLPEWVAGNIMEIPQDHSRATYTKKISKSDGLIDIKADPYVNFRKIQAYHHWPNAYFFADDNSSKKIRVKITKAAFRDGALRIERVIPEGRREMDYGDF